MCRCPVILKHISVPIQAIPVGLAGLRIAHVSDFHFRRWNRTYQAAQDLLLEAEFDLLAVTGDFCDNPRRWDRTTSLTRRFFGPIAERAPVYAVLGNHDHPSLAAARNMPVQFLVNESVLIKHRNEVFALAGIDQTHFGGEDIDATLSEVGDHRFTVLLAHYPSTVLRLRPCRVDLQLSGHTHGGQIRVPRFGCLWNNDRISRRMSRGLHVVGATFLHINPGIGVSMPIPLRINCPPEVTVLTLTAVRSDLKPAEVSGATTAMEIDRDR